MKKMEKAITRIFIFFHETVATKNGQYAMLTYILDIVHKVKKIVSCVLIC